ncbi:MAG: hypothetical protein AAB453_01890 [Patescibacteria group bacterium]
MARKLKDWKLWEVIISHPPDPAIIEKRWARSKKEAINFVRGGYYGRGERGSWTLAELTREGVIFSAKLVSSKEQQVLQREFEKIVAPVLKIHTQLLLPMILPVNPRF